MSNSVPIKKFVRTALLMAVLLTTTSIALLAQKKVITGVVKDDSDSSLPGVSILEKGTTSNGTVTDAEGRFSISVAEDAILVISFIGMKAKEVAVQNQSSLNITMEPDVATLNEVVVVDYGYGTVKKSDMTGAVATMSGKELSKIPTPSIAQALTGRLPGVSVTTSDGSPDADIVIRIRGGGSITQDNSPLYVVDGFIVPSMRDIPPSDVEAITVLKDAAATAIYGARGANGVIVITLKKAVAGKTQISYSGFMQYKYLPKDRKYDVLSPYEYVMANYEYARLRGQADVDSFEKIFGKYDDLELYKSKKPTDWQKDLFGHSTLSQYHNLNIRGGSETTKMMLSLTNNKDQGLMPSNGYQRNVINFKIDHQISKRLKMEASTRITNTLVDGAGTSNAQVSVKDAIQSKPVNGIADELDIDLTQVDNADQYQSLLLSLVGPAKLAAQDWKKKTTNNYLMSAAINWSIIDNLDFKSAITFSRTFEEQLRYYGPKTTESFNNGGSLPIGEKTDTKDFSYRWYNTLTYKLTNLGPHELDFLVGQEMSSEGGKVNFIRSEDFRASITPKELFANMSLGRTDRIQTIDKINSNRYSYFGRANYQFNGKYLATVTMRSDASSRFAKANRIGYFPALALGWKLSKEGFMREVKFVQDLKLRASYGATGNDRVDPGATQFLFAPSTNRGPGWGNIDNVYYAPSSTVLYNPFIKWETTIDRNVGLDFSLLNGRIDGSLDVYYKSTKDLLLQSTIPSNTGFNTQWNNVGTTSNRGVELGLNAYIIETSDFTLSSSFNIGLNRAKIDALDGTDFRFYQSGWASTDLNNINDFYLQVGGTVGDVYGYETAGYYTTDDFESYTGGKYILKGGVPNSTGVVGNTAIRPGFLKLADLNEDGSITADDRQVIGNTLPKFQGGFGFNTTYKGFDLSIFFNYKYGNDVYNTGKIQFNQFRRVTYGNMLNTMNSDNRFTYLDVDGSITGTAGGIVTDLAQLAAMNEGKTMWSHNSFGIAGAVVHSWAIEDGSFIRLNNLSVGYSLPRAIISKIGMTKFRLYATGNNLHVWTKYSGYDPEVNNSSNPLTPGVDNSSYPRSRSYSFGVDISF